MGVPQPLRVPKVKKSSRPISEARKVRKPLMEKKRRDRINACLTSLATLLAGPDDIVSSDGATQSAGKKLRLEKADILEQTVQHWHKMEEKSSSKSPESEVKNDLTTTPERAFVLGYEGCIEIIDSLLKEEEKKGEDVSFADDLRSHLRKHLKKVSSEDKKTRIEILDVESKMETILTLLPKWLPSGNFALIMQEFPGNQSASGCGEDSSINNSQRPSSPYDDTVDGPQHIIDRSSNVLLQDNVWRPW